MNLIPKFLSQYANKKISQKRIKKNKKKNSQKQKIKANLNFLERKFLKFIREKNKEKAGEFYQKLQKALDKAAKINVIKKNKASRKKSRLAKKLNTLLKPA